MQPTPSVSFSHSNFYKMATGLFFEFGEPLLIIIRTLYLHSFSRVTSVRNVVWRLRRPTERVWPVTSPAVVKPSMSHGECGWARV